jgi:hypothetical protein
MASIDVPQDQDTEISEMIWVETHKANFGGNNKTCEQKKFNF